MNVNKQEKDKAFITETTVALFVGLFLGIGIADIFDIGHSGMFILVGGAISLTYSFCIK